ncbi:hypothetical protein [Cryptosporangium japonicum]|uniref:hypothetical protein n=1 Tax=Cryptosporangium japonicum TaxID=80872 RepID=UPI0031D5A2D7
MIPPLSGETGDAVGRALDLLRIRLLADAASHQQAANHPPVAPRCHTAGTSPRRGTAA